MKRNLTPTFWRWVLILGVFLMFLAAFLIVTSPGASAPELVRTYSGGVPGSSLEFSEQTEQTLIFFAAVQAEQERQAELAQVSRPSGSSNFATPTTASEWAACTRDIESSGDYGIDTGNGYHGAYQFLQSTWDSQAGVIGRPDLIGVSPNLASPADQDLMALTLYDEGRGASHWGGRCQ